MGGAAAGGVCRSLRRGAAGGSGAHAMICNIQTGENSISGNAITQIGFKHLLSALTPLTSIISLILGGNNACKRNRIGQEGA